VKEFWEKYDKPLVRLPAALSDVSVGSLR